MTARAERVATGASGVGEVSQIERAVVEEAVVAAAKLHEAGDRPAFSIWSVPPTPVVVPLMARSDSAPTVLPALMRAKPFTP